MWVRPFLHADGTFSVSAWGSKNGGFVFHLSRSSLDDAQPTLEAAIQEGMRLGREAVSLSGSADLPMFHECAFDEPLSHSCST
jgi:hypothetical protein